MARVSRKNKKKDVNMPIAQNVRNIYKTAVYIRLSNEGLETGSNQKLDNQEQVVMDYIKDKPEIQLVKVYCDNGCTGTNFERASFEELMEDIKKRLINCVIVKDLSRLGRNHIETEQYISIIFPFLGVRFVAVNDSFDSLKSDCDITVSLKNIVNDAYAKDISRKIFSAKQAQRLKGEFTGNIPPYGYEKSKDDPHKLVINEVTGNVIQKIFQLKEQGKTNTEIAKQLNEDGEIAPMTYWYQRGKIHNEKYANRIWEATTIKVILRNQMYVGDMVQGKKQKCLAEGRVKVKAQIKEDYVVVHDTHKALIERSLFKKVQAICEEELRRNKEKRKKNEDIDSTENILENKIYSSEGLKMYRSRNVYEGNRVTYNYVTPKTRKKDGSFYSFCYISEVNVFNGLEQAVYTYIGMLFSIQEMLNSPQVKKHISIEVDKREKEAAILKRDMARNTECLACLYKDLAEGSISLTAYEELKAEYSNNKKNAKKQLKNLLDKGGEFLHISLTDSNNIEKYNDFLSNKKLTKEMVELLVKEVIVVEKKKIRVLFLFEDEVRIIYEKLKKGSI